MYNKYQGKNLGVENKYVCKQCKYFSILLRLYLFLCAEQYTHLLNSKVRVISIIVVYFNHKKLKQ